MTNKVALLQFVSELSSKTLKKPTVPFEGHHNMKHKLDAHELFFEVRNFS